MEGAATRLDRKLTAGEVDRLPHEWDTRYELIGGTLHMSRRPSHLHQQVLQRVAIKVGGAVLDVGGDAVPEPGILWEEDGDDNVAPDYVILLRSPPPPAGEKLRACPEIVIEILSPGEENRRRDLEAKRELYWRRGALEYWILDPAGRSLLRLSRDQGAAWNERLLVADDVLATPLLPAWAGVRVGELFP